MVVIEEVVVRSCVLQQASSAVAIRSDYECDPCVYERNRIFASESGVRR